MVTIRWTEEAAAWLKAIHDYIAQDNLEAAGQVTAAIYEKVGLLSDFPAIGHVYRAEPEGEIRILLYGHYRIAYLLRNRDAIDILGIFHGAMDLERYL